MATYYWDKYNADSNTSTYYTQDAGQTSGNSSKSADSPMYGYPSYTFSSSSGYSGSGTYGTYYTAASFSSVGTLTVNSYQLYDADTNNNVYYTWTRVTATRNTSTYYTRGSYISTTTGSSSAYVDGQRNSDGYWYEMGSEVNYAPSAPSNAALPAIVDGAALITWSLGSDSNGDSLRTHIDIAIDGTTYVAMATSAYGATSLTYDFTNQPASLIAKLRLRHYDGNGAYSGYIYSPTFRIKHNILPTAPTLLTPNGGEAWNGFRTITWTASTDEDGEPLRYQIQLSTDGGSNWSNIIALTSVGATSYVHNFTAIADIFTAKVRVRASDGLAYGPWDESSSPFTILQNRPPSAPVVTSPNGGEIWSSLHTVTWNAAIDDSGDPSQYHIQVSTDNGANWKTMVALTAVGATSYTYDFSNQVRTTTAKIRIRGFDGTLYGPWDESNNSFVLSSMPSTPTINALNGTSVIPVVSTNANPVFTWIYNHPTGINQGSYEVEIKEVSTGSIYWSTTRTYTGVSSATKDMSNIAGVLLSWRVRVWDTSGGVSAWSSEGYFRLTLVPLIETTKALLLTGNRVSLEGTVSNVRGSMNSEYGFVYGTTTNPTTANTKIVLGTTDDPITYPHIIQTITPATYHFRAYVMTTSGASYGNNVQVVVPVLPTARNQVARLTSSGELQITGDVYERLPAVTNGLVHHFAFDGTDEGQSFGTNLLDTSVWKIGYGGTQGAFVVNGQSSEANVIEFANPWGNKEATWSALRNDAASDADGGWNVSGQSIDKTKKYRLSVWVRRENVGDGTTYFGCQASTVHNLSDSLVNTNPYFILGKLPETYNNWTLFVAYIHPHDYTATTSDPTNGVYSLNGTRVRGATDFKWSPTATVGGHRSYLYYSTSTEERQYWQRPRFEVCDGTEPTIQSLLKGRDNFIQPSLNTNTIQTNDYLEVSGAGRIDISFALKPPYSINLWHKPNTLLAQVTSQATSPMIFQMGSYYTNASISFWNYIKALTVYVKGNTSPTWTTSGVHYNYVPSDWDNKEHMYTLVAIDSRTFRIYMDGKYVGERISSEDVTNITYLSIGNASQPNARYRDLSFYKRALTDIEAKKLYGHTFQMTEDGNLVVDKFIENPNSAPMSVHQKELHVKTRLIENKSFL